MLGRWVVILVVIVFIAYGIDVVRTDPSFANSQGAVAISASALLAAATAPINVSEAANELCVPSKPTDGYPSPSTYGANAPRYPNKYGANNEMTSLYYKSCSEKDEKTGIYIYAHCEASGQCHVDKYEGEDGKMHDIQGTPEKPLCSWWDKIMGCAPAATPQAPPATVPPVEPGTGNTNPSLRDALQAYKQGGPFPGYAASLPGGTLGKTGDVPAPTVMPPEAPSTVPNAAPSTAQSPSAIEQIQKVGAAPGGGLGGSGGQPVSIPTQAPAQPPGGPAFQQGAGYSLNGQSGPGGGPLATGYTPGYAPGYYGTALRNPNPTTFSSYPSGSGYQGGFARSSGGGARVASSFTSGFASLIGGLFSVPANNVVNYVQSFLGGAPQQTSANQDPGQQQNYAPGQAVVPYPMPTSRNTLTQIPPPPTSTTDVYAQLRAFARETRGGQNDSLSPGTQEDRMTSAFLEGERARSGTAPAGNEDQNNRGGLTPTAQNRISLEDALQMSTTFVSPEEATGAHATSTSYIEPRVVEVGIPVDITDLGSYESILAYSRGDWARAERTALQNKVALAQAQVQQEAIRAQMEALQDARDAGLCDDSCGASLTVLQNELPVMQSRVEALQTAVEKDSQPRPSSPPPTVAQVHRVVESLEEPTYKATIPRSGAEAPTAVSVSEQEAVPEVPRSKSEAIVTRVIQSIWNFLTSWFLPPTSEAAKPRPSCSLFASLFGRCK